VKFSNEGLTLWYGTPDAPAPADDVVQPRRGNAVVVGVKPASPTNAVQVRYRVDDGPLRSVSGARYKTDYAQGVDYFRALLPDFSNGSLVSYLPFASDAARTVPTGQALDVLPSFFRLVGAPAAQQGAAPAPVGPSDSFGKQPQNKFTMEWIGTVRVPLQKPDEIGITPEGIKVNWFWLPKEGIAKGPHISGRVRGIGGDWMTIRPDGIGLMDVKATIETPERALVFVEYVGYYDMGPTGYADYLARRWPERAPTRTTPRFHTAHPKYAWLNRIQGIGIGEVRMRELVYVSDMYMFRPGDGAHHVDLPTGLSASRPQ
jgi:hypothetical protein